MMRRMSVNDIYPGLVNESTGEALLSGGNHVTPVAAPMDGRDGHVAALLRGCHSPSDAARGCGSRRLDRGERLEQAGLAPIENVIVGEHAAIDPGGFDASKVLGVHTIVDTFRLRFRMPRDAGFQVYYAQVWPAVLEFRYGVPPGVAAVDKPRQWSVRALGERAKSMIQ